MSGTKDYLIRQLEDEEDKFEWIRERIDNPDGSPNSPGWKDASDIYDSVVSQLNKRDEMIFEARWSSGPAPIDPYLTFENEIETLTDIVKQTFEGKLEVPIIKMSYAHSVTLLESYLEDTLKINLRSNGSYLERAISEIDEIKKAKYGLTEITEYQNNKLYFVLEIVSGLTFHNIPKIIEIYKRVFDCSFDIEIKDVMKVVRVRHDIVHRNGRSSNGIILEINREDALTAINIVEEFVNLLEKEITVEDDDIPF